MGKLDQISSFINVIELNGFGAAARLQGITTAAVSKQVTSLEEDLGVELIKRTTRKLELTDAGNEYYLQCKKALNELRTAENLIIHSKKEATGTLNIMANRYFALSHILPMLNEFMRHNPLLHINFRLAEEFPQLEKEGIDILFGVSMEGDEQLIRKRVSITRYIMCATPKYLEQYGIPKTPNELIQHRYIQHSMRKPLNAIKFKDDLTIYLEPFLYLNDSFAMRECAIAGMGLVNLHDYMVKKFINKGVLVEVLREYQEEQKNIYLYYQQTRYLQPKIRRFIDFYTQ